MHPFATSLPEMFGVFIGGERFMPKRMDLNRLYATLEENGWLEACNKPRYVLMPGEKIGKSSGGYLKLHTEENQT